MPSIYRPTALLCMLASLVSANSPMEAVTLFNTVSNTNNTCQPACLLAAKQVCSNDLGMANVQDPKISQHFMYYNATNAGCYAQIARVPRNTSAALSNDDCMKQFSALITKTSTSKSENCDDLIGGIAGLNKNGEAIVGEDDDVLDTPVLMYGPVGVRTDGFRSSLDGIPAKGLQPKADTLFGVDVSTCLNPLPAVAGNVQTSRRDLQERNWLGYVNAIGASVFGVTSIACIVAIVAGAELAGAILIFTAKTILSALCTATTAATIIASVTAAEEFDNYGKIRREIGSGRRVRAFTSGSSLSIGQPTTDGPSYCQTDALDRIHKYDSCYAEAFTQHCAVAEE